MLFYMCLLQIAVATDLFVNRYILTYIKMTIIEFIHNFKIPFGLPMHIAQQNIAIMELSLEKKSKIVAMKSYTSNTWAQIAHSVGCSVSKIFLWWNIWCVIQLT